MDDRYILIYSITTFTAIIAVGISGYMLIENMSLVDAVYHVSVIFSTVGLGGEKLSSAGKLFTIFLVIAGLAVGTYAISNFTRVIVEVQIRKVFGKGFNNAMIKKLKNHYIICGGDEVTELIVKEFETNKLPFVVIENNQNTIDEYSKRGILHLKGDPIKDETLIEAGIANACGLISNLPSDVGNVFVVLSARNLNPKLTIITRSENENSLEKLKKAGADRVIAPNIICGRRMAAAMIRPSIVDFLDTVIHGQNLDLQMEEIDVSSISKISGKSLIESGIRQKSGVIVIAVRKQGQLMTNPAPNTVLEPSDKIIVLGSAAQIELIKKM